MFQAQGTAYSKAQRPLSSFERTIWLDVGFKMESGGRGDGGPVNFPS